MLRNKKGFTLVELLAVIVILAIILAIAVPTISTLISNQRKSAYAAGVKMMIKGMEYKILEAQASGAAFPYTNGTAVAASTLGGSDADYGSVTPSNVTSGSITVAVAAKTTGNYANCTTTGATLTSVTVTGC